MSVSYARFGLGLIYGLSGESREPLTFGPIQEFDSI
jgi:hypothetical protein